MISVIGEPERVLFQSPRFKQKLFASLAVVTKALQQSKRPYIAFSGGKDSVATAALVHAVAPDVLLSWSDDELEYPETVAMMGQLHELAGPQFEITLGFAEHADWFRPWLQRPYFRDQHPAAVRIDDDADAWHGRQGYDLTFTGVRMDESRRRRDWLLVNGPLYRVRGGTGLRCCPLWDWTADDVWALIAGWRLAYTPVYDRLESLRVPRRAQRVGPLPLARRDHLVEGWPELLARLEARYGRRWNER